MRDIPKSDGWVSSDFVDPKVMRRVSPNRYWWESFVHPENKPDFYHKILMKNNKPLAGMIVVDRKNSPFRSFMAMEKTFHVKRDRLLP